MPRQEQFVYTTGVSEASAVAHQHVGTQDLSGLGSDPHNGDARHATANHAPKQTGQACIVVSLLDGFTELVLDVGGTEVSVGGGGEYENVGG